MGFISCSADTGANNPWPTIIMIAVVVLVIGAMYFLSNRSQKKRQEETEALLNAIKPGNKVKTIGGICGVVVEICEDDGTFILETGTEASGKSYIKFDRQAVYKTDAVVERPVETPVPAEEAKAEEPAPAEEVKAEEPAPAPAEEAPKKKPATRKKAEKTEAPAETEENK